MGAHGDHGGPAQADVVRSKNTLSGQVTGTVIQAHTASLGLASITPAEQTPHQLPAPAPNFINRRHECGVLSRLASHSSIRTGPTVAVLSGMAGVGKTATAIHWGQRHRDDFAGGQLYVDFADYRHGGGVDVNDILGAFLRALGIHDAYVPADLPERSALFRTKTSGKRLLLVLDNVQQPAQVRPLMPGSAASMVVVTSRRRLSGLLLDGATLVDLKPLGAVEGAALVSQLAQGAASQHADAVAELVRLCGGLPIALRVAAGRLAYSQRWSMVKLMHYLSDEQKRLARLSSHDDYTVQSVFDVAYRDLTANAQSLYRFLGVHPGPTPTLAVVAYAMDMTPDQAEELLGQLTEANLLEETMRDRYRPHDLVRLHAQQCSLQDDSDKTRARVARRTAEWYLSAAAAADLAVMGESRWRLAEQNLCRASLRFDAGEGMAWFEAERANLLAIVRLASEQAWHDMTWQLCEVLWPLYYSKKYYADWIETHRLGAESASRAGDPLAEVRMYNQLGRAHIELAEFGKARAALSAAMAAVGSSKQAEAVVAESFGVLYKAQGQYSKAVGEFCRSRELNELISEQRGVALQNYHIGGVLVLDGKPAEALAVLDEAAVVFRRLGDGLALARVQIVRGQALVALSLAAEAREVLQEAASRMRIRGQLIKEVEALEALLAATDAGSDDHRAVSARLTELNQLTGSPVPVQGVDNVRTKCGE